MKDPKEKLARDVMKRIHDVLWKDWDPIGVNDDGPDDEYDLYIGGIYRILLGNPTESELIDHLYHIETETMGLPFHNKELLRHIAQKLMEIDVTLKEA
ncbi:MAG: hypothetical protein FP814_00235 [Desulfobacterium sp.]|nr:hypothetical protein [Desulfobacterium sp.]MBU4035547.1 hypothetical protein [Pseudomonadota bacterium]